MGAAATILSAVSTIGGGIMQYNASRAQAAAARAQAEAQARRSEQNAQLARNEAQATSEAGAREEEKLRDKIRRVQGAQAAAYGASGLSLASGSAGTVMADTAVEGEEDVTTLRENYQRKKFSIMNQATNYDHDAALSRMTGSAQASAYRAQGSAALGGSLLSAAGLVSEKWDSMFPSAPRRKAFATFEDELTGKNPVRYY